MSDKKVLTKEIAEEFLADEDSVDLSEFTAIEDDAAEILSKYGGQLRLDGLTELSDAAAESLSKQEGELYLDGLTELSDAAAESLSKHEGGYLYLDGLTELSENLADRLSTYEGQLRLSGVKKISVAVAEKLSRHTSLLELDGLTSLSAEAAQHLAARDFGGTWPVDGISLGGLKELSDPVVEALQHTKGSLRLNGILELSNHAALCLANYVNNCEEAWLELNSLRNISDIGILTLYKPGNKVWWSDSVDARRKQLRICDKTLQSLTKNGFFKYSKQEITDLAKVSYPDEGLGGFYGACTVEGQAIATNRIYGADVEELCIWGISYVVSENLSHLGIDAAKVIEESGDGFLRWIYGNVCYHIHGEAIGNSCYERAAFALVAILNQMLEDVESNERAYGAGEGNEFSIVFLSNSLRKIISNIADEWGKPITQKQLEKSAKQAREKSEPPLVTEQ